MDEWDLDSMLEWDDEDEDEESETFITQVAVDLADMFFLSDNDLYPAAGDAYDMGRLDAKDWWPLVRQLDQLLDWETVLDLSDSTSALLPFEGLPTELLEAPLDFLGGVLAGHLPPASSGRNLSSRQLLRIGQLVVRVAQELPEAARAAARAWADVHRNRIEPSMVEALEDVDLAELLLTRDLPPALAGFSMVIGMTMMRWPERAEGLDLPTDFLDPDFLAATLAEWEALPDSPAVTDEGSGDAETLFAQGQLAHTLAQMSPMGKLGPLPVEGEDKGLGYSRLSRAILWVHHQCRHCTEREDVGCLAASRTNVGQTTPLLDVASELAYKGRIEGCVKM